MSFAAYIPVGPSADERRRAVDVVESVVTHNRGLGWVILIDDGNAECDLRGEISRVVSHSVRLIVVRNPRGAIGDGHSGGLCVADLTAFRIAQHSTDAKYVLKLDTDSLVIRPCNGIMGAFQERPDAGIVGVIGDSFGENRTYTLIEDCRSALLRMLDAPVSVQALPEQGVRFGRIGMISRDNWSSFARIRTIIERALTANGVLGEYCQGGGYAVSRLLLERMAKAGDFDDPLLWRDFFFGEDVMMGLYCAAAGLKLYDYSGEGRPFAVQPECIPLSREELLRSGFSIIHSIKGHMEVEVRGFFRSVRRRGEYWNSRDHVYY